MLLLAQNHFYTHIFLCGNTTFFFVWPLIDGIHCQCVKGQTSDLSHSHPPIYTNVVNKLVCDNVTIFHEFENKHIKTAA